ncbi:hypothetical protein B7463_g7573, partial [Scytalidium lignicola]
MPEASERGLRGDELLLEQKTKREKKRAARDEALRRKGQPRSSGFTSCLEKFLDSQEQPKLQQRPTQRKSSFSLASVSYRSHGSGQKSWCGKSLGTRWVWVGQGRGGDGTAPTSSSDSGKGTIVEAASLQLKPVNPNSILPVRCPRADETPSQKDRDLNDARGFHFSSNCECFAARRVTVQVQYRTSTMLAGGLRKGRNGRAGVIASAIRQTKQGCRGVQIATLDIPQYFAFGRYEDKQQTLAATAPKENSVNRKKNRF